MATTQIQAHLCDRQAGTAGRDDLRVSTSPAPAVPTGVRGATLFGMRMTESPASDALVPERALAAGFSNSPIGTHTGKTMMLPELRLLLSAVPGPADFADYQRASVEENALAKATAANRSNTLMYLKQLYGLRPDIPVFVAMRELWDVKFSDQPILAMLCASARDVLLRSTADAVLGTAPGSSIAAADLSAGIAEAYPGRYKPSTLRNLGQNIVSSWTQGGLLTGGQNKHRAAPSVDVPAVVYAMYLGHLEGLAGLTLFTSRWARMLDRKETDLRPIAEAAGRSGWLEYRSSGGMTEIGFRHLDDLTGWTPS